MKMSSNLLPEPLSANGAVAAPSRPPDLGREEQEQKARKALKLTAEGKVKKSAGKGEEDHWRCTNKAWKTSRQGLKILKKKPCN
jgi:hypothetical protein